MKLQKFFTKKHFYIFSILLLLIGLFFLRGVATSSIYLPKPRGYPRLQIPDHQYVRFDKGYPYTFEYSKHAQIIEKEDENERYWLNIHYPDLNATIYITYKRFNGNQQLLKEYWKDFYQHLSIHYRLASGIDEKLVNNKNGNSFNMISIRGEHIASQYQFITSDHKDHFLIGVLYFNQFPDQEYLKPLIEYMKKDIDHLVETFSWK